MLITTWLREAGYVTQATIWQVPGSFPGSLTSRRQEASVLARSVESVPLGPVFERAEVGGCVF